MENEPLVLDLLQWLAGGRQEYSAVMEVWRTSCPRLTIWEDAVDAGFVRVVCEKNAGRHVEITAAGMAFLDAQRYAARADQRLQCK